MIRVRVKPPKKTARATAARAAVYQTKAKAALPHVQAARTTGAKNAAQIAAYLNGHGVPAPTKGTWTESAVLRCLRCLKKLGLAKGSLPPQQARTMIYTNRPPRPFFNSSEKAESAKFISKFTGEKPA